VLVAIVATIATLIALPRAAHAAGSFKLRSTEVNEVSGAWHIYVTIELPKAPPTAHQPMRFLFTKTVVYERSLVDGRDEPVVNRQPVENQSPSVESMDVNFADVSGKIHKATRFDFGLTRARGYEAGEYKVELRTSDGVTIGQPARLILKGDNPVVDRRAIAFSAKEKGMTKVVDDTASNKPKNDEEPVAPVDTGPAEVTPVGTATGFVPPEGFEETEEEKMRVRPKGCGCEVLGHAGPGTTAAFLLPVLGIFAVALRRRAARRAA